MTTARSSGFAKITRDVTERKEAQEILDRARETLFQSQKMDAVGQLTGGVAHDFNNLLMAVLGSLELLRKRLPDDPAQLRLVDNAISGAKRGATLTQRMLSFARRQQLDAEPLDVARLVRGMIDLLERTLGADTLIETDFPNTLGHVLADENQLELAVLNLCVNARDAMKRGGRILITARQEALDLRHASGLTPGNYICLSVTDTGEGMDAETLARASEPFFTTKGVGKGTGLGLSMVHGMAEQMSGRLVLSSKLGEGTSAEIWLPAIDGAAQPAGVVAGAPDPQASERRFRVLAVDDDRLVLFNTVAMLEDLGHVAVEAGSGAEALELLRGQDFDLVITDQSMPKMTRGAVDGCDPKGLARPADDPGNRICRTAGRHRSEGAPARQTFYRARFGAGSLTFVMAPEADGRRLALWRPVVPLVAGGGGIGLGGAGLNLSTAGGPRKAERAAASGMPCLAAEA